MQPSPCQQSILDSPPLKSKFLPALGQTLFRRIFTPSVGLLLLPASILIASSGDGYSYRTGFEFSSDTNSEGWDGRIMNFSISEGLFSGTATDVDPKIVRGGFEIPGNACGGILLRLRSNANGPVDLFWDIAGNTGFSEERKVTVTYNGSGDYQMLYLNPARHTLWSGQIINNLRIDVPGIAGDSFDLDWIRVLSFDYDNDGWLDWIEGGEDADVDGLPNLMDPDRDNDGVSDAWMRSMNNPPGSVHFNFENDGNLEGWVPNATLMIQAHTGGTVTASATGLDPQFRRDALYLQSGMFDGLAIRISTPQSGSIRFYWATKNSSSFNSTRSINLPISANNSNPQTIYFDLSTHQEWKGNVLTAFRLDCDFPTNSPFNIYWIRTSDGDFDRDGLSDSAEGTEDPDGDGLANFEDPDSDGNGNSDWDEAERGWNPYDLNEAALDSDGDGHRDFSEIAAGTDLTNAADRPQLTIQSDSALTLLTNGKAGRSYTLEVSDALLPNSWNDAKTFPHLATEQVLKWNESYSGPRNFYRLRILGTLAAPQTVGAVPPASQSGSSEDGILGNGSIRLEARYDNGGSLAHFSPQGGTNLINIHDQGRLIQQSYYAGDRLDRQSEGQSPNWTPWRWNPIQGGDSALNTSEVLEITRSEFGGGIYTRTTPLLWDMTTAEKAQCQMDQWNEIEAGMPNVVRVTCRLVVNRDLNDVWNTVVNTNQELPATYWIRTLSKVVSYVDSAPWTGSDVTELSYTIGPPWVKAYPSEDWIAMVDPSDDTGVGLYSPIGDPATHWWFGATGSPPGGPTDAPTMHMAAIANVPLSRQHVLVYRYWLIYGDINEIRSKVYELKNLYPDG